MAIKLRSVVVGAAAIAAAAIGSSESAQALVSGNLFNPQSTSGTTYESWKWVTYSANSNNWGGNTNPSAANANFRTATYVQCSGGTTNGSIQYRDGTALNPNGGDYVFWCPWPQVGYWTAFQVDPL